MRGDDGDASSGWHFRSPCGIICAYDQLTDILIQGKSKERSLSRPKGLENWEAGRNSGFLDSLNWNLLNAEFDRFWLDMRIIAYNIDHFLN